MYELLVIGNPKTDSEQVLAFIDRALKEANASAVRVDKLGRKNLAFTIAKQSEGEYLVFNFDADQDQIKNLNAKLRLEREVILRYFLVRQDLKKAKGKQVVEKVSEKEDNIVEKEAVPKAAKLKSKKVAVKVKGKK